MESAAELGRPKVLVVDDVQMTLLIMEKALSAVDCEVLTAESGPDALALAEDNHFAVALLDVHMPDMDGFELAMLLRENDGSENLPVLFVTGDNREGESVFFGYEMGAVDYLFKPVDPVTLRSKVEVFCELDVQHRTLQQEVDSGREIARKLHDALEEIETLTSLLPVCAQCKTVKTDDEFRKQVDTYLASRSEVELAPTLCNDCRKTV